MLEFKCEIIHFNGFILKLLGVSMLLFVQEIDETDEDHDNQEINQNNDDSEVRFLNSDALIQLLDIQSNSVLLALRHCDQPGLYPPDLIVFLCRVVKLLFEKFFVSRPDIL